MDYDLENELLTTSEWVAEWSESPALPPREEGGAYLTGDESHRRRKCFFRFITHFPRIV